MAATAAVLAHARHPMTDTDPQMGANLMVFAVRDWDELARLPDLDRLTGMAGLWIGLVDLALAGLAVATMVHLWAPPQDLPWKPLRLDDPVGLATHMKFQRAAADPALCQAAGMEGIAR